MKKFIDWILSFFKQEKIQVKTAAPEKKKRQKAKKSEFPIEPAKKTSAAVKPAAKKPTKAADKKPAEKKQKVNEKNTRSTRTRSSSK
jgi:D-alanyl-D-alanine carboxypeptidase